MGTPKQTEIKVGENTFLFVKLPALQASELFWDLAGKVAPALMDSLRHVGVGGEVGAAAAAPLLVGLGQAVRNLDRKALMSTAKELLSSTTYGGKPAFAQLDAVLDGPEDFFLLVWRALAFQYGPLFGAAALLKSVSPAASVSEG